MTAPRVLSLPCATVQAAQMFADWLHGEGVHVNSVEGRNVLVHTDNPIFAWDLAEAAQDQGWAHDDEVCAAVGAFLEGADGR